MVNMTNFFVPLAKKTDFNVSVKHIQSVIEILEDCDPKENIADKINLMIREQTIKPEQVRAILSVSLLDKWNYKVVSENLKFILDDASSFVAEVAKWTGIDLVFAYDHPDLGFIVINPKNPAAAQVIQGFRKNELLLIFVGKQDKGTVDAGLADSVISAIHKLFEKKACSVPASVKAGPFIYVEPKKAVTVKVKKAVAKRPGKKAPAPSAPVAKAQASSVPSHLERPSAVSTGPKKMSQLVSVPVSNELFHNGNVEAWKRIIRSYTAKYQDAEVMVYYDGERIVDINTLFKWGKVKHGSTIQFSVSAQEINDLSKLSKYFRQGASPMFEAFLRGSPDTVLNLF
ncbi:hypothetical protein E4O03_01500 [Treponema sp. OMZ 792]|uniref:hypothetical protein n=1 Tax=unclassified Treponema TaxID=2638727 RepID=UPI0020A397E7|nr:MULTISPECIES: hypothetical protein [unclassified Treponema]UTC75436.1 hypothetical protein E4O03_01500 [Treponema sp. OMZ 792]UTC79438.1 hypothetical protein E4O07_01525 [Treponema sp. OMZ 798]